ncbi:neuromedin-S [Nerophis ophidion]|uniref:neuromedin-S n=1 Tax=Nerophis ophidion TaxID=159077 RepID=UPI002ADF5E37|nr:neuromedin-S [Nerophis ophidion]
MNFPTMQHLTLVCLLCCCSFTHGSPYSRWEDDIVFRKLREVSSEEESGSSWRDQQQQVQNLFKRFLFHYSKAKTSDGPQELLSDSVHPLMRLSPQLAQRRKKTFVLLKI